MLQVAEKPSPIKSKIKAERKWLVPLFILLAGLVTFIPTLGLTGILDPSDGFFSESAREMFESGDYTSPRLNYEAYNNKPILTNWLICASYKLFGVSEFASRIPSALCATALCLAVYLFARRFLSKRVAALSSIILLSSVLFSALGRVSLTDMPLAFLINVALFAFFCGVEQRNSKFMALGYVALALSFLTKGPIAFLIAGGTFFLYFLATSSRLAVKPILEKFAKLNLLKALLITAAINLPWFIAVGIATKGAFITDFFFTENVMRAMGKIQLNHAQPPYFYAPLFIAGFFPWTVLLLASFPMLRKWWRHRSSSTTTMRVRLMLFCCAAALTVFTGFSVLKGKLPTYILPMFPSVAILTACSFDTLAKLRNRKPLLWTGLALIVAGVAALIALPLLVHLQAGNQLCANIFAVSCILAFSSYTLLLLLRKPQGAVLQLAVSWATIAALLVPFLFQLFYNHHQRCYFDLLQEARSSGKEVVEVVTESPSAPFYLHKHVPTIQNFFDLAYLLAQSPDEKLVLCWDRYEHIPKQAPVHRLIDRRQQYCLYAISDPNKTLLTQYYAKLHAAEIAHNLDPREPDPKLIITTPSRSIF